MQSADGPGQDTYSGTGAYTADSEGSKDSPTSSWKRTSFEELMEDDEFRRNYGIDLRKVFSDDATEAFEASEELLILHNPCHNSVVVTLLLDTGDQTVHKYRETSVLKNRRPWDSREGLDEWRTFNAIKDWIQRQTNRDGTSISSPDPRVPDSSMNDTNPGNTTSRDPTLASYEDVLRAAWEDCDTTARYTTSPTASKARQARSGESPTNRDTSGFTSDLELKQSAVFKAWSDLERARTESRKSCTLAPTGTDPGNQLTIPPGNAEETVQKLRETPGISEFVVTIHDVVNSGKDYSCAYPSRRIESDARGFPEDLLEYFFNSFGGRDTVWYGSKEGRERILSAARSDPQGLSDLVTEFVENYAFYEYDGSDSEG